MVNPDTNTVTYSNQLAEKVSTLKNMFTDFNVPELEVFESQEKHYRMRAEFRVWHEGEDLYYIMFDQKPGRNTV